MSACFIHGFARSLPTFDSDSVASRHVQHVIRHETIVNDDVCLAEQTLRAQGQQVGCSRSGTNQDEASRRLLQFSRRWDLPANPKMLSLSDWRLRLVQASAWSG